jgi:hypothetical protein
MNLTPFQQAKIDPLLQELLTNTREEERLDLISILSFFSL